jgi:ribosomal protein S18 acetylase RimI-like enzyme
VAANIGKQALLVRSARAGDAPAIARVHVRSWQHTYRGIVPDAVLAALDETRRAADWRAWLTADGQDALVAEHGTELVGFCSLGPARDADALPGTGEVLGIYVAPEHVRRGVGRSLLTAALARARGRHDALTLWVFEDNGDARRFYEAFGFELEGARERVALGGAAIAKVRYRRELRER